MSSRPWKALPIGVVLVAATFAFVFSLLGPSARAFPSGQVGHSGSPDTGAATCANCHQGADRSASLTIDAPTSMHVGETTTVTITLRGGPGTVAGVNAAALPGVGELLAAGAGVQFAQGEVTHTEPASFINGEASFSFEWKAPDEPTTIQWFAAGVSGNSDAATTGDAVATARIDLAVLAAPTPTPTPTPTSTGSSGVIVTPTPTPTAPVTDQSTATAGPAASPDAANATSAGAFGFGLSPQPSLDVADTTTELAVTGTEVVVSATLALGLFSVGAASIVAGRRRQR